MTLAAFDSARRSAHANRLTGPSPGRENHPPLASRRTIAVDTDISEGPHSAPRAPTATRIDSDGASIANLWKSSLSNSSANSLCLSPNIKYIGPTISWPRLQSSTITTESSGIVACPTAAAVPTTLASRSPNCVTARGCKASAATPSAPRRTRTGRQSTRLAAASRFCRVLDRNVKAAMSAAATVAPPATIVTISSQTSKPLGRAEFPVTALVMHIR